MVNGELLRATAIVRQMAQMRNGAEVKRSHGINFVVADIAHYVIILSMAWLQKQNPDIHWDTGVWHWRTRTKAEDGPIRLVSSGAFVTTMHAEHTHGYELDLYKLGPDPDRNTAGGGLMATGSEPTVPESYRAYAKVFSEADLKSMPSHGPQDMTIELLDSKQLP
jgi:hypothetical protein